MESDKEIISRLKFIGRIQTNEKINVKGLYIQTDNILTKIYRTFFTVCNRQNTINFVSNTVYRSFTILENLNQQVHMTMCANIVSDLKQAKNGLVNIRDTYIYDTKFICDIDTLLQDIDIKLVSVQMRYTKVTEPSKIADEIKIDEKVVKQPVLNNWKT